MSMPELARRVLREGFAPQLPTAGLEALAKALAEDSPELLQHETTAPPPLQFVQDWPVEGADAIAYALWRGNGLQTVEDVESAWAQACYECDQAMNEPAACRYLLNWFADTPRAEAFAELLPEVRRVLAYRRGPMECDR